MGAFAKWIAENNGVFNVRWRGWEDNHENSGSLCGNYLNLGFGGEDFGCCFCVIGSNHIEAYGAGKKDLAATNVIGCNHIIYKAIEEGQSENVLMNGNTFLGANIFKSSGARNTVIIGLCFLGANVAEVDGGDSVITLVLVLGDNTAIVNGNGNSVITAINLVGLNDLRKNGDGTNVMTAINAFGINSLVCIGNGTNVMSAVLLCGINFLLKDGDGTNVMTAVACVGINSLMHFGNGENVMTAFNMSGVNFLLKVGDGVSTMTAFMVMGVNALTMVGNGTNVMTAFNATGLNFLMRMGGGVNVMTAINGAGVNVLLQIGDGLSVMTAVNIYGANILTRIGNGINVMTAFNLEGLNVLTQVGDGLSVMTAANQNGVNILTHVGNGINVMTAGNDIGVNTLTSVGDGISVMTAVNRLGVNALVRIGNGFTTMAALILTGGGVNAMVTSGDGVRLQAAINLGEEGATSFNFIFNYREHDEGAANWRDGVVNAQIALTSKTNIIVNLATLGKGDAADLIVAISRSFDFSPKIDISNFGKSIASNFNKSHESIMSRFDPASYSVKNPFAGIFGDKTTTHDSEPNLFDAIPGGKKSEGVDEAGKRYWKVDSSGYVTSGLKNFFGISDKFVDFFSKDALFQAAESLKSTNLIMAGFGSDIVVAYAERNIILADSWSSLLDVDVRMLEGGGEGSQLFSTSQLLQFFGELSESTKLLNVAKFTDLALPFLNVSKYTGTIPEIANFRYSDEKGSFEYIRDAGRHNGEKDTKPEEVGKDVENFILSKMALRWDTAIYPQLILQLEGAVLLPKLQDRYSDRGESLNRSHAYTSELGNLADMLGLNMKHFSNNPFGNRGGESQFNASVFDLKSQLSPFVSWVPFLDGDIVELFRPDDHDSFNANIDALIRKYSSIFGTNAKGESAASRMLNANGDVTFSTGNVNMVFGGVGDDLCIAIGSQNFVFGGPGDDKLFGFGDYTQVYGGEGADLAIAIGDDCVVSGGNGNDILLSAANATQIDGGNGDDIMLATGAKTGILGGGGNDILIGLGSNNSFSPGTGTNVVIGAGERNTYVLQGGYDFFMNFGISSVVYSIGLNSLVLNPTGDDAFYYGGDGHSVFLTSGHDDVKATSIKNCSYFGGSGQEFFELGGSETNYEGGLGEDIFTLTKDVATVFIRDFSKSDHDTLMISAAVPSSSLAFFKIGLHLYVVSGNTIDKNFKLSTTVLDGWFQDEKFQSSVYFDVSGAFDETIKLLNLKGAQLKEKYINEHVIQGKTWSDLQALVNSKEMNAANAERIFSEWSDQFWDDYKETYGVDQSHLITPDWIKELIPDQLRSIQQSCFAI